ncbi:MAG: flagellar motor protein MotB [Epsilonproteobacteria bacterium]|nr:flagellar motor protein MotB [Campylobacterota bacterium]
MARKKQEECPSLPGWLVSFGDLMSLLLTFFILLYAMSTIDITKAIKFLSYFQGEPQFKPQKINIMPPIIPFSVDVVQKIKRRIKKLLPSHAFQISITTKYAMIRLFDDVIFEDGSYNLTPKAKEVLNETAKVLKNLQQKQKFFIRVQGHTSIKKGQKVPKGVKDAWDLSIKRAVSVVIYLIQKGVDPSRFFVSGYGDSRPLYTWNNPILNRRNNRVEIYIEVDKPLSKPPRS